MSTTSAVAPGADLASVEVDPVTDPRWAQLVERAPGALAFHHPAWMRLLGAQYGYAFDACCLVAPDGRLVAGLPVAEIRSRVTGARLVALPFSDLCPPLVAADAPRESGRELVGALDAMRRRRGLALEVRGGGTVLDEGTAVSRFHHHVLTLEPDLRAVERRFRKPQALRGVRRARREGLVVERRTDASALAEFYTLHLATRHRLGMPTQPRRFVLRFSELFAAGLGFVLLVRRDDRALAGAVFLAHRGVLTYKYGASDAASLALRPNNLLFWEAIRWGVETGMHSLDFGRTDWGHDSLRAFKHSWGADESELHYHRLGGAGRAAHGGRATRALGTVIRRGPPVVSRLTGEILYRHAG
jgi:CelD/BcsL family acetyltransferase involved in cellulose biosynthesis